MSIDSYGSSVSSKQNSNVNGPNADAPQKLSRLLAGPGIASASSRGDVGQEAQGGGLNGEKALEAALDARDIKLDKHQLERNPSLADFGKAIDAVNRGDVKSITDVGHLVEDFGLTVEASINLVDNDNKKLNGFATGGKLILLDSSLNYNPEALKHTAIEELAEAAFQRVIGGDSEGDFS